MGAKKQTSEKSSSSTMITWKLTYEEFVDNFSPAFYTLSTYPTNPKSGKLKYAIKRTIGGFQKLLKAYQEKRKDIFEERALKDEHGNPLFDDKENYKFETADLRKEAFTELKKLNQQEVSFTLYPVKLSDIVACTGSLTLGMEMNLGKFIKENEELESQILEDEKAEVTA